MEMLRDQIGEKIALPRIPQRIVSVVPSQTELLCDLGLEEQLVGITKFCVHPEHLRHTVAVVGGTKKLHVEEVLALDPDLIIAGKEENLRKDIETFTKTVPVYTTDIASAEDCLDFVRHIGQLTNREREAEMMIDRLEFAYAKLKATAEKSLPKNVLYLIWKDPYMAAGVDTYISRMMGYCGLKNVLSQLGEDGYRYPKLDIDQIRALNPDLVLFSSEPFPFQDNHIRAFEKETGFKGYYVDGEVFSWYGSRILHKLKDAEALIHELDLLFR